MRMKARLAAACVLAATLVGAMQAAAAVVRFDFTTDTAASSSAVNAQLTLAGSFTLDTDVPDGTLVGGSQYAFSPTALTAFDVKLLNTDGSTFATLGQNQAAPSGYRIRQGFNGPGGAAGDTVMQLRLANVTGTNALTGLASNSGFEFNLLAQTSTGSPANLLYTASNDLLSGIDLTNPLTLSQFRTNNSSIVMTNLNGTNAVFSFATLTISDATPPVSTVPLPAGGLMLLGGLGCLALWRRRRPV